MSTFVCQQHGEVESISVTLTDIIAHYPMPYTKDDVEGVTVDVESPGQGNGPITRDNFNITEDTQSRMETFDGWEYPTTVAIKNANPQHINHEDDCDHPVHYVRDEEEIPV